MKRVGIVVPTLFTRTDYLRQCLESIKGAGDPFVLLMGPNAESNSTEFKSLIDDVLEEPTEGSLSQKLSLALSSFPEDVEYIGWIGDDDLLTNDSLELTSHYLDTDPDSVLVFGSCEYIDEQGRVIGKNKSGRWALALSRLGPFLAPQPGSLFRKTAFETVGGLDSQFGLAFDFDLFLSLSNLGRVSFLDKTLAKFRWHSDSLSVDQRKLSVKEASMVRKKQASRYLRPFVIVANPLISTLTLIAGQLVKFIQNQKN